MVVLAVLSFPALTTPGQISTTPNLHAEIQRVYNFQPHTLSSAQIAQKSAVLDQFWNKAKVQRDTYVPALRQELADFSNPPFFLYDGASLLSTLSNDPADRKIILAAIAHTDLRDLQMKDYFFLVHKMAALGEDTTAAAFTILATPNFQVFIPQHVLTLGQNYCLVYMLLPTDQQLWQRPAIDRLHTEKDETAQKSLLLLLWYAQTPESDKAIEDFASDASKPQASKTYANEMAHRKDQIGLTARAAAHASSEQSLRQARRERMKAISDEALIDLDSETAKIIAKRK
jgi:hypothetical protein